MYGYIYLIYDQINKKIYIGRRKGIPNEPKNKNYYGSGVVITNIIKKHGTKFLKRKILGFANSKEELNIFEIECINFFQSRNKIYGYNLAKGGEGGNAGMTGKRHSEQTKLLFSKTRSGENNNFYGKKHSEQTKKLLRKIHTMPYTEVKQKIESKGYTILTQEQEYINQSIKIKILCPNNHIYEVRPYAFLSTGHRCIQCYKEKVSKK